MCASRMNFIRKTVYRGSRYRLGLGIRSAGPLTEVFTFDPRADYKAYTLFSNTRPPSLLDQAHTPPRWTAVCAAGPLRACYRIKFDRRRPILFVYQDAPSSCSHSLVSRSSFPNPLDTFRNPDIVCLKFVKSNSYNKCSKSEQPFEQSPRSWVPLVRDIIDNDGPVASSVLTSKPGIKSFDDAHVNPTWLCSRIVATNTESITGFKLPYAKGARVSGTKPRDNARSNVQW